MTENNEQIPGAEKIRIGISSCLLGEKVRFDSGHKRDSYINGTLSQYFDFIPYCPEVAIGLGIPRQAIRLVFKGERVHVTGTRDPSLDVTDKLHAYGRKVAGEIQDLSGYILKKGSPSCGMERVKVYHENGNPLDKGSGAFAEEIMQAHPLLPVEEEGRLGDPVLRENFIVRVFVFHRWQRLLQAGLTAGKLVEFHSDHKYLLMAHSQAAYRRMGQLVAEAGKMDPQPMADTYGAELMNTLKHKADRKQHTNVLQHLVGYLREHLDDGDRQEMAEVIEQYRIGQVPLIVPITLLRHHFRRHPDPYILRQHYLHPHPDELMLRNLI